jgi:alpha-1,2-mannosyltransferase
MVCLTLAFANTLGPMSRKNIVGTIVFTCIGGLWGWPFALAYGAVFILQQIIQQTFRRRVGFMIIVGIITTVLAIVPLAVFDSDKYDKTMVAPWNLIHYNLFNGQGGPNLYGTEPWWYYFANGFLNFNVSFLFALLSIPVILLQNFNQKLADTRLWVGCLPFYFFLGVFSLQPHKEERFMYVVFPLICFNAAVGIKYCEKLLQSLLNLVRIGAVANDRLCKLFRFTSMAAFVGISILRIYSQYHFYNAPLQVYSKLYGSLSDPVLVDRQANVCVGKEWYRFPSHFFIPNSMRVKFVKSRFRGLLPSYFGEPELVIYHPITNYRFSKRNFTSCPTNNNNMNIHEEDRYVFMIDLDQH